MYNISEVLSVSKKTKNVTSFRDNIPPTSCFQVQTSMGKEEYWFGSYRVLSQINGVAMFKK